MAKPAQKGKVIASVNSEAITHKELKGMVKVIGTGGGIIPDGATYFISAEMARTLLKSGSIKIVEK
jgi:hypothetical protein